MKADVRAHYARLASAYGRKANRACDRAYRILIRNALAGAQSVLETGSGTAGLAGVLDAPIRIACDLTPEMLRAAPAADGVARVTGDAECLPFPRASFDAVFSVNLVEHVPNPERLFAEAARVLKPDGRCLVVTPNGEHAWLLNLLERLRLKLPEGPHRFLDKRALFDAALPHLELLECRRFLIFPAGPAWFVGAMDAALPDNGLFQYALFRPRRKTRTP